MTEFDLLRKTELKILPVFLKNANLTTIAATVADLLDLPREEVLVVDYRESTLVLDILNSCVNAYHIVGKQKPLLAALAALPGVSLADDTTVLSDGMLGWISMDEGPAKQALRQSETMVSDILGTIAKRVMVFSSGAEVEDGEIEDTNTPAIKRYLEAHGFSVFGGQVLKDSKWHIAAKLKEAAELGGYGTIITTGGVGAEDKDQTVEAIEMIDPGAVTPYICHFKIGTGRHVKDGVKIAVGEYNGTTIIALPGPNDEVRASLEPLLDGLKRNVDKQALADMIAHNLRQILRRKINHAQEGAGHEGCQLHVANR